MSPKESNYHISFIDLLLTGDLPKKAVEAKGKQETAPILSYTSGYVKPRPIARIKRYSSPSGNIRTSAAEAYAKAPAATNATGVVAPAIEVQRPQSDTQSNAQPKAQAASQPEAQPASQPEAQLASQPEAQPASRPEAQPASQPETKAIAESEAQLAAQSEAPAAVQAEAQATVEQEAQTTSQPGDQATVQPEAQAPAQPEAQATAQPETEARLIPEASPQPQTGNRQHEMDFTAEQDEELGRLKGSEFKSWKEISAAMGKPPGALKKRWAEIKPKAEEKITGVSSNNKTQKKTDSVKTSKGEIADEKQGVRRENIAQKISEVSRKDCMHRGNGKRATKEVEMEICGAGVAEAEEYEEDEEEFFLVEEDDTFTFKELNTLCRLLHKDNEERWLRIASRFTDETGRRIDPYLIRDKLTGGRA